MWFSTQSSTCPIFMSYCTTLFFMASNTLARELELVLLHTNDVHARVEQSNKYGGICRTDRSSSNECFGGVARRRAMIQEIRNRNRNVLLLDAGDEFQGTNWFMVFHGTEASHFMNMLEYDAMALGNHEFDNGVEGLKPFLEDADFPVLSCNLNASNEPLIRDLFRPYTEKVYGGETVGIVGYTTHKTSVLVDPDGVKNLVFHDEVEAIRKIVEDMKARGINKIIAVGHAGFEMDQTIAREVDGVDVVIGGHSNTFLMTGEPPSNEDPQGDYPHLVTSQSGATVLVVQAFAFGKYLGFLKVNFNDEGEVTEWEGNPILLDGSVERDPETLEEVKKWEAPLANFTERVVGETRVFLDGTRDSCRLAECTIGDLVTDAILFNYILMTSPTSGSWSDTSVVLWNSGGMRVSIPIGPVLVDDILQVLPFRNTVEAIKLKGKYIREALELSASKYNLIDGDGGFLQMSGVKVEFDLSQPVGERVHSVYILCTNCEIPEYKELDNEKVYGVLISTYLLNKGDGYSVFSENLIQHNYIGSLASDWLLKYFEQHSPIIQGLTGRISYVEQCTGDSCTTAPSGEEGTIPAVGVSTPGSSPPPETCAASLPTTSVAAHLALVCLAALLSLSS